MAEKKKKTVALRVPLWGFGTWGALLSQYGFLCVLTLVVALPFAVPALVDAFAMRMGWTRLYYLPSPVDNQWFMLQFGVMWFMLPYCLGRVFCPPDVWQRNALTAVGLAFGLAHLASAVSCGNFLFALKNSSGLMLSVVLFLLIGTMGFGRSQIERICLFALLSMLPVGVYALAQSRGWDFLPYAAYGTLDGDVVDAAKEGKQGIATVFGHPNFMGAYMAPLFFWSVYFAFSTRRWHVAIRVLCAVVGFLMLASMVVGGTRGPLLGLAVGFAVFYARLAFVPGLRRPLLFFAGVAAFLVMAILFIPNPLLRVNFSIIDRLLGSTEIASRFYFWIVSLELVKDFPLLGVGSGGFNHLFWPAMSEFQASGQGEPYVVIISEVLHGINPGFVHNDYLQFLCEGGIVTLALFLALWAILFTQTWQGAALAVRHENTRLAVLCVTFLASFVVIAVDCVFNFSFHIPVSLMWFWVMAGLWVACREGVLKPLRKA